MTLMFELFAESLLELPAHPVLLVHPILNRACSTVHDSSWYKARTTPIVWHVSNHILCVRVLLRCTYTCSIVQTPTHLTTKQKILHVKRLTTRCSECKNTANNDWSTLVPSCSFVSNLPYIPFLTMHPTSVPSFTHSFYWQMSKACEAFRFPLLCFGLALDVRCLSVNTAF